MKYLLIFVFILTICNSSTAEISVTLKGEVINHDESLSIITIDLISPLKLNDNGEFETVIEAKQLPFHFSICTITKNGKITNLIPIIWVNSETFEIKVDASAKSYQSDQKVAYQEFSELLESASFGKMIDMASKNPNLIPSLHFVEKSKEKVDLDFIADYLQKLNANNRVSDNAKFLSNYHDAKQLKPVAANSTLENFSLLNKELTNEELIENNGKTKLIALMSTSCYYAMSSVPFLAEVNAKGHENLEIISIWSDSSFEIWQERNTETKSMINWRNLWDPYHFAKTYFNRTITPTFIVVDENGKVLQRFVGYNKKTVKKISALIE